MNESIPTIIIDKTKIIPDSLMHLCRENLRAKMRDKDYISNEQLETIREKVERRQLEVMEDLEDA